MNSARALLWGIPAAALAAVYTGCGDATSALGGAGAEGAEKTGDAGNENTDDFGFDGFEGGEDDEEGDEELVEEGGEGTAGEGDEDAGSQGGENTGNPDGGGVLPTGDGGGVEGAEGSAAPGDGGVPGEGAEGGEGIEGGEGVEGSEGVEGAEGVEGIEGMEGAEGTEGIPMPDAGTILDAGLELPDAGQGVLDAGIIEDAGMVIVDAGMEPVCPGIGGDYAGTWEGKLCVNTSCSIHSGIDGEMSFSLTQSTTELCTFYIERGIMTGVEDSSNSPFGAIITGRFDATVPGGKLEAQLKDGQTRVFGIQYFFEGELTGGFDTGKLCFNNGQWTATQTDGGTLVKKATASGTWEACHK